MSKHTESMKIANDYFILLRKLEKIVSEEKERIQKIEKNNQSIVRISDRICPICNERLTVFSIDLNQAIYDYKCESCGYKDTKDTKEEKMNIVQAIEKGNRELPAAYAEYLSKMNQEEYEELLQFIFLQGTQMRPPMREQFNTQNSDEKPEVSIPDKSEGGEKEPSHYDTLSDELKKLRRLLSDHIYHENVHFKIKEGIDNVGNTGSERFPTYQFLR